MKSGAEVPIIVLGGGGHAKVVVSTLQALDLPVKAIYDDSPTRWGTTILGVRVEGPLERLSDVYPVRAVVAIGDNEARWGVVRRFSNVDWATVVHPRAYVHSSVQLGAGTVVFAGAVIQPDVVIGSHVIINTGATVDHDCSLGDYVHVAPGAHLAGGVSLRDGVVIGVSGSVIPGRSVGAWTTVGAGAVVVQDLPAHVTAVGVPARSLIKKRG